MKMSPMSLAATTWSGGAAGKGKDVGRRVSAAPLLVQRPDIRVADEMHADLRAAPQLAPALAKRRGDRLAGKRAGG